MPVGTIRPARRRDRRLPFKLRCPANRQTLLSARPSIAVVKTRGPSLSSRGPSPLHSCDLDFRRGSSAFCRSRGDGVLMRGKWWCRIFGPYRLSAGRVEMNAAAAGCSLSPVPPLSGLLGAVMRLSATGVRRSPAAPLPGDRFERVYAEFIRKSAVLEDLTAVGDQKEIFSVRD